MINVDVSGLTSVKILLHNKGQFYNPNYMNLFGSDKATVQVAASYGQNKRMLGLSYKFELFSSIPQNKKLFDCEGI